MKVFIGLTEIAGYYTNLVKGLQEKGIDCIFVQQIQHPFHYEEIPQNWWLRSYQWLGDKKTKTPRSKLLKKIWFFILFNIIKIPVFIFVSLKCDVFIFSFATSFFNYYELPILKLFNKKIIYVFHGSDSRPSYIDGYLFDYSVHRSISKSIHLAKNSKNNIQAIEKYADLLINHPLTGHFHNKSFISWFNIGIPFSESSQTENSPKDLNSTIRILHSPSAPISKGTLIIKQAIDNLKIKGYPINFIEITGKPHSVVIEELKHCDFVVDQLYSDTPLAGFATEAAFFAKPAIVGGYAAENIKDYIPEELIPPSYFCHPDKIEEAIEKLIVDTDYRIELGKKAKAFVKNQWNPSLVADRYIKLIEGNIPNNWFYDPQKLDYLHGFGLSELKIKEILREIISIGGKEALQLSDNPQLEQRFVEFAMQKSDNA